MEAFGGKGFLVEDPKDLRGALDEAMAFPGPALVNVVISQGSARKASSSPGIADRVTHQRAAPFPAAATYGRDRHAGSGNAAGDRDRDRAGAQGDQGSRPHPIRGGTVLYRALAWLGADVVKVEEPHRGEPGRWGTTDRADADSHYSSTTTSTKRSVTCNLKSDEGKALLRRMIGKADVLIENMAPGTFARLGFDYPRLSALNPRLIFAQVKGFAPESPHANYLSFDMIAQADGGTMGVNGHPGEPPVRPGPTIGRYRHRMLCAMGIIAALYQRVTTGRGQHIQIAMRDAMLNYCRTPMSPPGRPRGPTAPWRQHGARDRAGRPLQMLAGGARRLVLHLCLAGQRGALAPPSEGDRPRGPIRRSAHGRRSNPRPSTGRPWMRPSLNGRRSAPSRR